MFLYHIIIIFINYVLLSKGKSTVGVLTPIDIFINVSFEITVQNPRKWLGVHVQQNYYTLAQCGTLSYMF